jgi:hypothetical protein
LSGGSGVIPLQAQKSGVSAVGIGVAFYRLVRVPKNRTSRMSRLTVAQ